jgi:Secretion system C-terminal sorting domain
MSMLMTLFAVVLAFVILVPGAFAANIAIIESQSFNANHIMDLNWQAVAVGMGHTVTMYPQTSLDNGGFITPNDIAIISSGVIPLNFQRRQMIIEAVMAGTPVYLQCERDPNDDTNLAWEEMLDWFGFTWTWQGTDAGNLVPMYISGPASNITWQISNMPMFQDGAFGVASGGVETTHHYADREFAWLLRPTPDHALVATNTDQEWVRTLADPNLMKNYIDLLLSQTVSHLQVNVWISGPVVLPNTGGTFNYFAQAHNTNFVATTFDAWIRVQLPNNNLLGPLQVFTGLNLPPTSSSSVVTLTQSVPGFAPPGNYFMHGVVGSLSWPINNIDAFQFQKLVVAADGEQPVDNWDASGFENAFTMSSEVKSSSALAEFELGDAYPNPFNPSTSVSVTLSESAPLNLAVYDVNGRLVAQLADGVQTAGEHTFTFDGHDLASGVYFVRAESPGNLHKTSKIVLLK